MKPLRYDFPDRLRGLSSAAREMKRLERSMTRAWRRGDKFALDYLERRHDRASNAYRTLAWRIQHATPPPGTDPEATTPVVPPVRTLAVQTPEFSREDY